MFIMRYKICTGFFVKPGNKRERVGSVCEGGRRGGVEEGGPAQHRKNKSCRRTASSPAGYILYCNIFIIKPYNIGHTDLDVFVCKSFCYLDIIIQV